MRSLQWHLSKRTIAQVPLWVWLGLVSLFVLSIGLRIWGLTRFNSLVFDEVYFAKYGQNYLTQTEFFDVHPPLGKYLIGVGIWLSRLNPFGYDVITSAEGFQVPTASFRWLNAVVGSLIPLVVVGLAYQLTRRFSYALLAGWFTGLDGLFLVESRYALINIYLVLFGLLGQWFCLIALHHRGRSQDRWLFAAGIALGACISVKWNGLAFLLSIYVLWAIAQVYRWLEHRGVLPLRSPLFPAYLRPLGTPSPQPTTPPVEGVLPSGLFGQLAHLRPLPVVGYLGIVPAALYYLIWQPHLRWNTSETFVSLHRQIFQYHQSLGGADEHPYCSTWLSWPWMARPVGYFYQKVEPSNTDPALLNSTNEVIHYDVHGMGNPILYWLGTLGVMVLVITAGYLLWKFLMAAIASSSDAITRRPSLQLGVALYLLANYGANWLPWAMISRCAFLYHYMGASIFSFMAIAWWVDRLLRGRDPFLRLVGASFATIIVWGFMFWLPIFLGLPLSDAEFRSRMWFESWY